MEGEKDDDDADLARRISPPERAVGRPPRAKRRREICSAAVQRRWEHGADIQSEDGGAVAEEQSGSSDAPRTKWTRRCTSPVPSGCSIVSGESSLRVSSTHNRLLVKPEAPVAADGYRPVNIRMLEQALQPHLRCPECKKCGSLVPARDDEVSLGLGSVIRYICTRCKRPTLDLPIGKTIEQANVKVQELNLRYALASVVSGTSEAAMGRIMAILGMPALEDKSFARAMLRMIPALEAVGDDSCRQWLEEERALAIRSGAKLRSDGRVPIPVSYDAQWLKPFDRT